MINFKICFNLDVAVMLEAVASVFVGLSNGKHSFVAQSSAAEALETGAEEVVVSRTHFLGKTHAGRCCHVLWTDLC